MEKQRKYVLQGGEMGTGDGKGVMFASIVDGGIVLTGRLEKAERFASIGEAMAKSADFNKSSGIPFNLKAVPIWE